MGGRLQGLGPLSEEDEAEAKIYWPRMWSFFQALEKVHQSLTCPPQPIRVKLCLVQEVPCLLETLVTVLLISR